MAVAALSTSAIALATGPATTPPAAASEGSDAFAKLVSRGKSDGQPPQGEARPETAEGEAEMQGPTTDATPAASEGEVETAPAEKVDLLAEIEALFAAAAQIGVAVPVTPLPVATVLPTVTATSTTDTSSAVPSDSVSGDAMGGPQATPVTAGLTAAPVCLPAAAQPAFVEAAAAEAAKVVLPIGPGPEAGQTATPAPHIAADPAADGRPTATLRRDIAAIVASLKAAFHPVEAGADLTRAAPDAQPTAPVPLAGPIVVPFVQTQPLAVPTSISMTAMPIPALPATPVMPVMPVMPVADATSPVPAEIDVPAEESPVVVGMPETVAHKTTTTVATKTVPAVAPDHADPMTAARATELAASITPLAAAPASDGTEPSLAAPAAAAPAPFIAPVIPVAVTPASWNEAPLSNAAAAAPNHIEQSVVRHLDLARDTQWLDQLARDISQSVTQQNHMKFQLNPEHLGALTVEIANSIAGTSIRLTADTDQARTIIADAQPRLLAEVRAQGLRVAESHVDLNQQGSGSSAFAQGQQRQSSEDSKPFVRTQATSRDDASDSVARDDGELYA